MPDAPYPGLNPPVDPAVEAAIAAERRREAHPGWYALGQVSAVALNALLGLAFIWSVLLLSLDVIGGLDLGLRAVLGIALAVVVTAAAIRRPA